MKNQIPGQVIGIPISTAAYPAERSQGGILSITANQYYSSPKLRQSKYLSLSHKRLRELWCYLYSLLLMFYKRNNKLGSLSNGEFS